MTNKETVLKAFPGAVAFLDEDWGVWSIYDDTVEKGLNLTLGEGATDEEAWEKASKNPRVVNYGG